MDRTDYILIGIGIAIITSILGVALWAKLFPGVTQESFFTREFSRGASKLVPPLLADQAACDAWQYCTSRQEGDQAVASCMGIRGFVFNLASHQWCGGGQCVDVARSATEGVLCPEGSFTPVPLRNTSNCKSISSLAVRIEVSKHCFHTCGGDGAVSEKAGDCFEACLHIQYCD